MSEITLRFHAFVIGTEGIRTDDEGDYLEGEVDFDAVIEGRLHRGLVAKVKQAAGSSFADPLEVEWPERLSGSLRYDAFRECVELYVRRELSELIIGARSRPDRNIRIERLRVPAESSCDMSRAAP